MLNSFELQAIGLPCGAWKQTLLIDFVEAIGIFFERAISTYIDGCLLLAERSQIGGADEWLFWRDQPFENYDPGGFTRSKADLSKDSDVVNMKA